MTHQIDATALIANLPEDIRRLLPPYIRKPQPFPLLNDISNYSSTLASAKTLYHHAIYDLAAAPAPFNHPPIAHLEWLVNDICAYINDDRAYMNGFDQRFYSITSRAWGINSQPRAEQLYFTLSNSAITKEINVYWGLLTPRERQDFININFTRLLSH